ncbi:MAG: hypothetical protein AB7G13_16730 [Lautropia sp.]
MLKTVGASGQLSLGKRLAGRHFQMEVRADGSILLAPVTVTRADGPAPATKRGRPRFHVFKVTEFELPKREALDARAGPDQRKRPDR